MKEFRRDVPLHKSASEYFWVELGPIAGYPSWHEQSKTARYPFPTAVAAGRFADSHAQMWPGRKVEVLHEGMES